jgi:hypothetical protein
VKGSARLATVVAVATQLALSAQPSVATLLYGATLLSLGAPVPARAQSDAQVRNHWVLHCAGCHRFDGSGLPKSGIPSLVGNVGHFLRTPEGRAFLIQVPGTAHSPLTDAQVATLLNWMLQRFSAAEVPGSAAPYTADEVHAWRSRTLANLPAARAAIVEALRRDGVRVY